MKKSILLFCSLFLFSWVQAQFVYVSGNVSQNSNPVSGATVTIEYGGVPTIQNQVQTDANGDYADSALVNVSQSFVLVLVNNCNGTFLVDTFFFSPAQNSFVADFQLCTPTNACQASFGWSTTNQQTFNFQNVSSTVPGNPIDYFWDFGDGNTSTAFSPSHTYQFNGSYNVCLTVVDSLNGCVDVKCTSINVTGAAPACNPSITITPNPTGPLSIQFTAFDSSGVINQYFWDFGDGNSDTGQVVNHTYAAAGTYTVCLVGQGPNGCQDSSCFVITLVGPGGGGCVAAFTYNQNTNGSVFFTNQSVPSQPFFPLTYSWDFGDGSLGSTLANPFHAYNAPGTYNACLIITDQGGCSDTVCQAITVTPTSSNCVAEFLWFNDTTPGGVQFVDSSSSPNPIGFYYWDFGDGSFSTQQNPYHVFAQPDTYLVCLVILDSIASCADTVCYPVIVNTGSGSVCDATFSWITTNSPNIQFAANSPNQQVNFTWDFGDGNTSSGPFPSNTYSNPGTYLVCLTVSGTGACQQTHCDSVVVPPPTPTNCQALFSWQPQGNNTFQFVDASTSIDPAGQLSTPTNWFWDFGDSTFSTLQNPVHTFNQPGPWNVCLTIVDSATGCLNIFCATVGTSNSLSLNGSAVTTNSLLADAVVYLIQQDSVAGTLSLVDSVFTNLGGFTFQNVAPGEYLVKAALLPTDPNYANTLPTYLGDVLFWNQATSVVVTTSSLQLPPINMVAGTNPGGPGFIGGLVSQGANKTGDPLVNVSILLMDDNMNPVTHTITNGNGEFGFSNLAYGTYNVFVEIPGTHGDHWTVTLDANNPALNEVNFTVNGDGSITTGIEESDFGQLISIYPNPVRDHLQVSLELIRSADLQIVVSDLMGRSVYRSIESLPMGNQSLKINLSGLPSGVYLLDIQNARQRLTHRIMKE